MTDDQRRVTSLRENLDQTIDQKALLEALVVTIQSGSEEEVTETVRELRQGADIYELANQINARQVLSDVKGHSPQSPTPMFDEPAESHQLEPAQRLHFYDQLIRNIMFSSPEECSEITRRIREQEDIRLIIQDLNSGSLLRSISNIDESSSPREQEYSSWQRMFGLIKSMASSSSSEESLQSPEPRANLAPGLRMWTSVTDDDEYIHYLMSIYFSWHHSFFQTFPERLFRDHLYSGRLKYCSGSLVNAICAVGCFLSIQSDDQKLQENSAAAGALFYNEAVRMMKETHTPNLTTTAALFVLSHVDGLRGNMQSLWELTGRSGRMALDLTLHRAPGKEPAEHLSGDSQVEELARKHIFWGIFIADQITSFTMGRLPQIPLNAVTVGSPQIRDSEDEEEWSSPGSGGLEGPGRGSSTFYCVASLSMIVNSTLLIFHAPAENITASVIRHEFEKYTSWFANIPAVLRNTDNAPPHIMSLHMYYNAAVLLLFRPFLSARFDHYPEILPKEICKTCASRISELFAQHRSMYGITGICTFQLNCLLTASTIHLVNTPSTESSQYLLAACNHFRAMIGRTAWAVGSLNVIRGLVRKWKLVLPKEVEEALNQALELGNRFTILPPGSAFDEMTSAGESPFNPGESLSRRTDVSHGGPSVDINQRRQTQVGVSRHSRERISQYFFTPFPNQPAPLLAPMHKSPAGTDVITTENVSNTEQVPDGMSFDGGWLDPFMGKELAGDWGGGGGGAGSPE
ncbi:MAG: hypothetical protein M1820_008430 [Bogoriella megaspora]|nr:MAG: hypothetical protein M1820_008430 [Bogoriella megaspora]